MNLSSSWTVLPISLVLAACSEADSLPTAPTTPAFDVSRALQSLSSQPTLDGVFTVATQHIPGFAGAYVDEAGMYVVRLAASSLTPAAARARAAQISGRPDLTVDDIRIEPAAHDFLTLKSWHNSLSAAISHDQVTATDVDEVTGTVFLGVASLDVLPQIQRAASSLGIPPEVLRVEQFRRIPPATDLDDRVRPIQGGLRITGNGACTLGANAKRAGVEGFITNSHCTPTFGVNDGSIWHQWVSLPSERIGVESYDPPLFTGSGCPAGRECRRSDAVFVKFDPGVSFQRSWIARTMHSSGSKTINPSDPHFDIVGAPACTGIFCPPLAGSTVNKMGASSGWTTGSVTNTCFNTDGAQGVRLLCQVIVADFSVIVGDSGSPVFRPWGFGEELLGILWGGGSGFPMAYSSITFVNSEIGGSVCYTYLFC